MSSEAEFWSFVARERAREVGSVSLVDWIEVKREEALHLRGKYLRAGNDVVAEYWLGYLDALGEVLQALRGVARG